MDERISTPLPNVEAAYMGDALISLKKGTTPPSTVVFLRKEGRISVNAELLSRFVERLCTLSQRIKAVHVQVQVMKPSKKSILFLNYKSPSYFVNRSGDKIGKSITIDQTSNKEVGVVSSIYLDTSNYRNNPNFQTVGEFLCLQSTKELNLKIIKR